MEQLFLLKTAIKYQEFFPTLFVKATDFQLVFNFEQTHTVTILGEHGIMAHKLITLSNDSVFNNVLMQQIKSFMSPPSDYSRLSVEIRK